MSKIKSVKEYQEATRRTRAKSAHKELASFYSVLGRMRTVAHHIGHHSESLDRAKKVLFYGQEDPHFPDRVSRDDKWPELTDHEWEFIHAVLGVVTEAGEMLEQAIALMEGGEVDWANVGEESGDAYWYHAWLADLWGASMLDDMHRNIAKLRKRFPQKFAESDALNRDLDAEREVLENE
jgi:NTP pyrophosphatase (non-canonical NTP hydrolase)